MKKLIVFLAIATLLVGCGKKGTDENVIVIGATAVPHADFLEQLKEPLENQGYRLEIVIYDDYIIPNTEVDNGNLDANYFQHIPYLTDFNEKQGTDIVSVLPVHYEPIAIYAGQKNSLEDVANGDVVFVPDDATNLPRALKLLEEIGWITLNENRDKAELTDIVSYNVEIEIEEVKSDSIAPLLNDAPFAIINGNYALASNITEKGIQKETVSKETIANIVNVVAVRRGNENSLKTQALLEAFKDPKVVDYIETKYSPAVTSVLGD